jgi:anti-sigma-K factor RskA
MRRVPSVKFGKHWSRTVSAREQALQGFRLAGRRSENYFSCTASRRLAQIPLGKLPPLQPNQLFELTLEPVNGSPTGRPTGPIQFIGRAFKVI